MFCSSFQSCFFLRHHRLGSILLILVIVNLYVNMNKLGRSGRQDSSINQIGRFSQKKYNQGRRVKDISFLMKEFLCRLRMNGNEGTKIVFLLVGIDDRNLLEICRKTYSIICFPWEHFEMMDCEVLLLITSLWRVFFYCLIFLF